MLWNAYISAKASNEKTALARAERIAVVMEQLRDLDSGSNHLQSDAIRTIAEALNVKATDITNISVLKKGMTNRSFLFSVAVRRKDAPRYSKG